MFVHVNGIDIYYEKCGAGRPFLIIHGNGENLSMYKGLAAGLAQDFEVYSLDTRCHGKSTKTKTISYNDMMEDTAAFITELGLEKPVLLGASDGGITGLLLAIKYPEMLTGLIACGANTHPLQLKWWFRVLIRLSYLVTRDPKIKLMLDEPDIKNEELGAIQIPALILAGSRDIFPESATREIAAAIKGSELKILKGETHDSYLKKHKRVMEAIGPFLAGLLR